MQQLKQVRVFFLIQSNIILNSLFWLAGLATPLHRAASSGKFDICRLLLQGGADINKADGDGKSALQRAKESNHRSVVELLTELGAVWNL
jgi:ankyrin repeat protein